MINNISVIVVAAGEGLRMGAELPKQFLSISSRPILIRTIECFTKVLPSVEVIIALHRDYITYWQELCEKYKFSYPCKIVVGGDSRFHSVKNSLTELSKETRYVLIHDAARPFVSSELILNTIKELKVKETAIPAVDIVDSIRCVDKLSGDNAIVDRTTLKSIQTPQGFLKEVIQKGYESSYRPIFTDDASVVENSGFEINLIEGEKNNIKITTPNDMLYGAFLIENYKY